MASRRAGPPPESPEFGKFVSAPQSLLDADDDPIFTTDSLDRSHTPLLPSGPSKPIHVQLPPRPDEITPDYMPPPQPVNIQRKGVSPSRSPTRRAGSFNGGIPQSPPKLTQRRLSMRTPHSPAAVNDSGRDIIFHSASGSASLMDMDMEDDGWLVHANGISEKNGHREGHHGSDHGSGNGNGNGWPISTGSSKRAGESSSNKPSASPSSSSPRSPIQSRLLDTLATTGKIASKWRQSIEHDLFDPPPPQPQAGPSSGTASTAASTGSASLLSGLLPNVTHSSPFATAPQLAGSYVPPSGAPGFMPQEEPRRRDTAPEQTAIRLNGRSMATQAVLEAAHASLLHRNLPPRQRLSSTWTLAYSSDQHGASLGTLYRNIERRTSVAPTGSLVVLTDAQGGMFGAFVNEPLKKREGQYYGTGESFLFKFTPDRNSVRIFRWTGKNQYFALCESGYMSFGGGGTYGLLVDSTMSRGSSATCKTYDNEVLCRDEAMSTEKAVRFECIALEVWMTS